jgi:YVTN family beta-propeller protein
MVSVIDAENLKEVARIPVGEHADRIATLVVP